MNYNTEIRALDFVRTPGGTARVIAAHLYTLNVKYVDGEKVGKSDWVEYTSEIITIKKKQR